MKKIIALLLVLVMALSLVACGNKADEKVTLNVIAAQYGGKTADWWVGFEKDFEAANENIDLVVDVVSWNDIYTVVNTRISNNDAPDILNIDVFADYQAEDLLLPAKERTRAIIMPQYSFGKNQGAYGLMVGFVKKHGAFLRAKSDFSFISTHGACDENGLIDGHMPWYTGKSAKKRWAVTAGYVARVAKPLYLYGGVGYGQRVLAWERQDGSYVEYQENTYKGIEAELGVMGRFGIFALSAGVQTNSFKYMEFNVGVGVMF